MSPSLPSELSLGILIQEKDRVIVELETQLSDLRAKASNANYNNLRDALVTAQELREEAMSLASERDMVASENCKLLRDRAYLIDSLENARGFVTRMRSKEAVFESKIYELISQIAGYQSTIAQLQIALEDAVEHAALSSICGVSSVGFGTACFCQDIRKLVPHLPVATILRYISSLVCEHHDVETQTDQSALTSAQETRISDLTEICIQTDPIAPTTRGTQTSPGDIPKPRHTFSRTEEWSNKSLVTQIMPKFSKKPNYDSMAYETATPPIRPATPPHISSNTLLDDPLETENPTKLNACAKLISESLNLSVVTQDPINGCTVIHNKKHASEICGDYSVIMSDRSAESLGYIRNPMHLTNSKSSETTIYTDSHIKTRESAMLSGATFPDGSDAQKALEDSFHEASTKISDDKTNDEIISYCADTRPSTAGKSETFSRQRGENSPQRDLNSVCTDSNHTAMPDHKSTGEDQNKLAALKQISSAVNEPAAILKSAALIWSSCEADKYPITIESTSANPQKTRTNGPNKKPPTKNGLGNHRQWVEKNNKVSGEVNSNNKGVSIRCSPPQSVSGLESGGTQEDLASVQKMLELEKEFVTERGCSRSRLKKPSARLRVVNDDYGFADDPEMVAIFREFEAQLNHQKSLKRRKCVPVPP